MRYKADETWHERIMAVYEITRDEWYASRAPAA
jgi:hypothetical protein